MPCCALFMACILLVCVVGAILRWLRAVSARMAPCCSLFGCGAAIVLLGL